MKKDVEHFVRKVSTLKLAQCVNQNFSSMEKMHANLVEYTVSSVRVPTLAIGANQDISSMKMVHASIMEALQFVHQY